jgi:hypothetical protein
VPFIGYVIFESWNSAALILEIFWTMVFTDLYVSGVFAVTP